jgi:Uma2 family endonuclease
MATASLKPPAAAVEHEVTEAPVGLPEGVPFRLSAADYFRMVEGDIIPPDRRVGLWEGQLYEKMSKKLPHSVASSLVITALMHVIPIGWFLWPENPILVNDFSAPLPDFSLIRGAPNDYLRRRSVPNTADIGLVIEIAESSLRKNLTETLSIYARAGLAVYWVVNLVARRVEVYSQPRVDGAIASYAVLESFDLANDVPLVLDGREVARIPARDLLPQEPS